MKTLLLCASTLLVALEPVLAAADKPADTPRLTVVEAGADWIPLTPALDIVAGSALDFSAMGFVDPPAGKHGWVIARADGQFAFEQSADIPRKFYGVNFCFGAHYVTREEADRLAERLVRLGYNAVRVHHYERDLVQGQADSVTLNAAKLEQLDDLMAAWIQRGLYVTTDLYVSRPVPWRDLGEDRRGSVPMNTFKVLVPVHEGAWENWKQFTRALLDHRNPHTGRRYAEEPGLAWLSMINEGNLGNFFDDLKSFPAWRQAWNRWLAKRYASTERLRAAWGDDLQETEDAVAGTVQFPDRLSGAGGRVRDCIAFLSDTEKDMVTRMKRFLREDLGCRALISNANSWTYFTTDQEARAVYDYVDDHFYVDHPQFLEQSWRLPSRCPNTSPVAGGADGGRSKVFTRLLDRPFTITEYNYSGPGRFRGVGGILTGAMGALQDWGGIWRFAYSHSREAMFSPRRMGYFDLVSDPLSQAAERASLCLFLRGDMRPAPHSVSLLMTEADLGRPADRIPRLAPRWHWMAWLTRVGTRRLEASDRRVPDTIGLPIAWRTPASAYTGGVVNLDPYAVEDTRLLEAARERGILASKNPTDPTRRLFRSETGEITIDAPRDAMILDTPRTAGGYAPAGQKLVAPMGGVTIEIRDADATVWVSALDQRPIAASDRLLVTHLTDLQNSGIRYREPERQTLLDWGELPYLVRAGRAELEIDLKEPGRFKVWALGLDGSRAGVVPCEVRDGALRFTVDVGGDREAGARLLYEIAAE